MIGTAPMFCACAVFSGLSIAQILLLFPLCPPVLKPYLHLHHSVYATLRLNLLSRSSRSTNTIFGEIAVAAETIPSMYRHVWGSSVCTSQSRTLFKSCDGFKYSLHDRYTHGFRSHIVPNGVPDTSIKMDILEVNPQTKTCNCKL